MYNVKGTDSKTPPFVCMVRISATIDPFTENSCYKYVTVKV
jgi:hypothetical protein